MPKSTIAAFIAGLAAACLVLGIVLWSKSVVDHTEQKIVDKAVASAAQQASRQVGEEGVRNSAKEIADKLLAQSDKRDKSVPPSVEVATVETQTKVDKDAYSITMPPGITVDPQGEGPGSDHILSTHIGHDSSMNLLLVDHKENAPTCVEDATSSIQKKMDNAEEFSPAALPQFKAVNQKAFWGKINGVKWAYEVGGVQGKEKACVIILGYSVEEKAKTLPLLKKALESLQMKQ